VVVATKFGHYPFDDPELRQPTEKTIRHCVEQSLTRLQTDYIDLYQIHQYDPDTVRKYGILATLEKLRDEGRIRHAGASIYGVEHARDIAAGGSVLETVQESFNVVALAHEQIIAESAAANLGVIIREPLGNGLISGKYTEKSTWDERDNRTRRERRQLLLRLEMAQRVKEFLIRDDRSLVQALIKFVLQTAGVSVVIPGCKNVAQTVENMKSGDCPDLTDEELSRIRRINAELEEKYGHIHPYAFE
jgi:aryl-alcohol dehydrogenase-like predicted oxidoreductase